jgi:plastocyanin
MRLLTAVVAVALAASGCGGGGGGSSKSGSPPSAVSMKGLRFHPDSTTVRVGEKVTWTNDDSVDHNVTAKKGASFKSSNFGKGGTFTFTPKKAGRIQYTCTIHPGMEGTLTVTK